MGERIRCVFGCGAWLCRRSLPDVWRHRMPDTTFACIGELRNSDPRACANRHARSHLAIRKEGGR